MKKISENTSMSISLVITVLAAVAWLTTMHNTGVANASAIKEIKESRTLRSEEYNKTMRAISERLASIESKIETTLTILKRKNGG